VPGAAGGWPGRFPGLCREVKFPGREPACDPEAELLVNRDHVLVRLGIRGDDGAHLGSLRRQEIQHGQLDEQAQPVAAMRPGD
jgi:hypothetical protein